jgi:uncharacterized membrane protein YphA (DoxX/SURF4 family)
VFYRVDYMLAVLFVGFIAGVLPGKVFESVSPSRLGQGYYVVTAILLGLRTGLFACSMLLTHQSLWSTLSSIVGDLLSLFFGCLLGLAARRRDTRALLTNPSTFRALCMGMAFTFALAGIGKAFSMAPMSDFFTKSGYSVSFLKFIVIAEIFGAIGLLLPWAVLPAILGLSVDMFGAVLTHIHNGDPLNDSTGAIGMLIRLAVVGVLWELSRRTSKSLPHSMLRVGVVACVCLVAAFVGGSTVRDVSAAATSHSSQ